MSGSGERWMHAVLNFPAMYATCKMGPIGRYSLRRLRDILCRSWPIFMGVLCGARLDVASRGPRKRSSAIERIRKEVPAD